MADKQAERGTLLARLDEAIVALYPGLLPGSHGALLSEPDARLLRARLAEFEAVARAASEEEDPVCCGVGCLKTLDGEPHNPRCWYGRLFALVPNED